MLCAQFWEDVSAYNLTFSTPDPEVPNEPAAATLRRETVRKAKVRTPTFIGGAAADRCSGCMGAYSGARARPGRGRRL